MNMVAGVGHIIKNEKDKVIPKGLRFGGSISDSGLSPNNIDCAGNPCGTVEGRIYSIPRGIYDETMEGIDIGKSTGLEIGLCDDDHVECLSEILMQQLSLIDAGFNMAFDTFLNQIFLGLKGYRL